MIKEFKEFIMRGDVLDLAVGVVIGSAFTSIVNQVVQGLITPLIGWFVAMITGTSDHWFCLILSCQSGKPCEEFTLQRRASGSGRNSYCRRLS